MDIREAVTKGEELVMNALETLPEKALNLGIRIVLAVLFFLVGVQVIKLLRKIVKKSMERAGAEVGAIQFIDSFLRAALYVILTFVLAASFGVVCLWRLGVGGYGCGGGRLAALGLCLSMGGE